MAKRTVQRAFNPGYASAIVDAESKQRYADKIKLTRGKWQDNTDMWQAITYVHVYMYLILYPSPYTKDDMLNYKSLDSFKNFQNGWVREVLMKEINDKKWKGKHLYIQRV